MKGRERGGECDDDERKEGRDEGMDGWMKDEKGEVMCERREM